ncbi:MAG: hypothetical protein M1834_000704 [Cirrosporium novae-zelandiae]|nr:MAG: hypothetical protein M1834_000704 [Cirrosporium novae-zelandiae]
MPVEQERSTSMTASPSSESTPAPQLLQPESSSRINEVSKINSFSSSYSPILQGLPPGYQRPPVPNVPYKSPYGNFEFDSDLNRNSTQTSQEFVLNPSIDPNGPAYVAAREEILKKLKTSQTMPPPTLTAKPGSKKNHTNNYTPSTLETIIVSKPDSSSTFTTPTSASSIRGSSTSRGRGRGRPRGRGRGRILTNVSHSTKRKHDSNNEDNGNSSSSSEAYTLATTQTRSGRTVTRPTTFVPSPTPTSNGSQTKRQRRRVSPGESMSALCKRCLRGHSPLGNAIVYCDGCNAAWHQRCHEPWIEDQVVVVKEREWFCGDCRKKEEQAKGLSRKDMKELERMPEGWGDDERRGYLNSLPHATLVSLLLHAATIHPGLPLFPSSTSSTTTSKSTSTLGSMTSDLVPMPSPTASAITQPPPPQCPSSNALNLGTNRSLGFSGNDNDNNDANDDDEELDLLPYPRAGTGIAFNLLPSEAEDLDWLVDEDKAGVFSHKVKNSAAAVTLPQERLV